MQVMKTKAVSFRKTPPEDGWDQLVQILILGKAGKPYKHHLPELKKFVDEDPELSRVIASIKA